MAKTPQKPDAKAGATPASAEAAQGLLSRKKLLYGAGIAGGLVVVAAVIAFFVHQPELPPDRKLRKALSLLDDGREAAARRIAQGLEDDGYQDTEFPGGVSFVLGICAFRDAAAYDDLAREERYLTASTYLREAERLSLPEERRPEWAYATGISLYQIGQATDALPLLEEAVRAYPPGKEESSLLLAQLYMEGRTERNLEQALELNSTLLADAKLRDEDAIRAWLQRAQILLALDRRDESEQALARAKVLRDAAENQTNAVQQAQTLLTAQTLIADHKYREAIEKLDPLARDRGLERTYPAQALYLMGVCSVQLDELENAVAFFQRTAERFDRSHEAQAARLGAASALRKLGRTEEALENYAQVLRSVSRPKSFRNRWVTLKKLQDSVLEAWNAWMEHHYYQEAIALAEMMSPTIPREEALELAARASRRWAQHLEAELAALPADRQAARRDELELRWKRSGEAYARLAENRRASSDYFADLWAAAEDFGKGHDYEAAIARLNLFIEDRTSRLLPAALVRRGEFYMSSERLDDALRDFQQAIQDNPTDPVAFQARYLIGLCHLERNEVDQAERAWRNILESPDLTPTAVEWRAALYSLGKVLYDTAELARREAAQAALAGPEAAAEKQAAALARFDEAILRLEEFRDRSPNAPETPEVRFLLARALQKSAEFPEARWKAAETDNARNEYRRQMEERLDRAIHELQQLQALLLARQSAGQLDQSGQVMLRNCFFEIANCNFLIGRYEAAIAAYSASAGRYQQDPDSLGAYVQIANCYDRMQKPAEALSTLAQALLILKQLPDDAFTSLPSAMSRDDWQHRLDWAMKIHN